MRKLILLLLLLLPSIAWGATIACPANTTCNLSSGTGWTGGVAPNCTTDAISINATNAIVNVDQSCAFSSTGSGASGITVNATSSSVFGTFQCLSNSTPYTITLTGTDKSTNLMALVNNFGKFLFTGSACTLTSNLTADFVSQIVNKGIMHIGTSANPGTVLAGGNLNWNNTARDSFCTITNVQRTNTAVIVTCAVAPTWPSGALVYVTAVTHTDVNGPIAATISGSTLTYTLGAGGTYNTADTGNVYQTTAASGAGLGLVNTVSFPNVKAVLLDMHWISNSTNNGPAAVGNSSLVLVGAGTCTGFTFTEQSSLDNLFSGSAVNGWYYVDYVNGVLWYYSSVFCNVNHLATYLSWFGFNILSNQNADYNELVVDGATINYAGPITNNLQNGFLQICYKGAGLSANSRNFQFTNNTLTYGTSPIGLICPGGGNALYGTSGSPVNITGNTITGTQNNGLNQFFNWYSNGSALSTAYVNISNNIFKPTQGSTTVGGAQGLQAIISGSQPVGVQGLHSNWKVQYNVSWSQIHYYGLSGPNVNDLFPDLNMSFNAMFGFSGIGGQPRAIGDWPGSNGHPALIHDNLCMSVYRCMNIYAWGQYYNNIGDQTEHHFITGPITSEAMYTASSVHNNLNVNSRSNGTQGTVQTGYNVRTGQDNTSFFSNTNVSTIGNALVVGYEFGDDGDNSGTQAGAKLLMHSNSINGGGYIAHRCFDNNTGSAGNYVGRFHVIEHDYNNGFGWTNAPTYYGGCTGGGTNWLRNQATFYINGSNYNDPATSKNATGVSLWDISNLSAGTLKVIVNVVSSTNITVQICNDTGAETCGTATQLVLNSNTGAGLTAVGSNVWFYTNVTDSTASFIFTYNSANNVAGGWLRMLSGGQVNKAFHIICGTSYVNQYCASPQTSLEIVGNDPTNPIWGASPIVAGDTYVVIAGEVGLYSTLDDGSGNSFHVGIDARALPTAVGTYTDGNITLASHQYTLDQRFMTEGTIADWQTWNGQHGLASYGFGTLFTTLASNPQVYIPSLLKSYHQWYTQYAPFKAAGYLGADIGSDVYNPMAITAVGQ